MILGIIFLALGLLMAAFKAYVAWDIAHDLFNGGGAPTLDFPIFYPIPIALGGSMVLSALGKLPFPGFGCAAYLCFAVFFSLLLWLFDRLGAPARQRQAQRLKQEPTTAKRPKT